MIGSEPFMYSSDFPHEVNAQTCKRELSELIENAQLSDEDKEAILFANTLEFYGLGKEGAEEKTTIHNAFPDRGVQTMKLNYFSDTDSLYIDLSEQPSGNPKIAQ
jgi:hypothetical protein